MLTNSILKSFKNKPQKQFLDKLVASKIEFKTLKEKEKKYFLQLLRVFFFYDLELLSIPPNENEILYKKILSFLYSCELGDGINISVHKDLSPESKKIILGYNISDIRANRFVLEALYSYYISQLKLKKLTSNDITLSKIIFFEAPPYRKGDCLTSHFLFQGGTYYKAIVGEISETKRKHVNSDDFLKDIRATKKWKVGNEKSSKSLEDHVNKTLHRIDELIESDIVYLDLFLLPIHIDPVIRKQWTEEKVFFVEGKNLIVYLLEWAIQDFKARLGREYLKLFSNNCLLAFGMPLNTSIAIFEHYTFENFLLEEISCKKNYTDISRLNSPTAFKKMGLNGTTFPMFKSNVIGGNNLPDHKLVKNAFNLIK